MQVIKPNDVDSNDYERGQSIFLAGSIEMGKAEDWQKGAERLIYVREKINTIVYNPRRDNWNSSWKEGSAEMIAQVDWELRKLSICTWIIMYFDPATKSPITLLEFGLYAPNQRGKLIVICPDGFWKRTNIVTTSKFYGTTMVDNINEALDIIFQ